MKKLFFLGAAALLISAGVIAQSSESEKRVKTKKEIRTKTRQQIGANEQAPEIDQLMTRKQEREQLRTQDPSGDPIMQRTRSREKIHQQDLAGEQVGRANRATARGNSPGTVAGKNRSGKSQAVNPPARAQGKTRASAMQARPATKMQGAANGIRAHRPATTRGSGAGR